LAAVSRDPIRLGLAVAVEDGLAGRALLALRTGPTSGAGVALRTARTGLSARAALDVLRRRRGSTDVGASGGKRVDHEAEREREKRALNQRESALACQPCESMAFESVEVSRRLVNIARQ
jgi:hypothetical protein